MGNRNALVTGGGRGIGRAICLRLAKEGIHIALCYAHGKESAEETAAACEKLGVKTILIRADVSSSRDVKAMFCQIEEQWGGVDILVNNAGIVKDGLMMQMKDEDFDEVINTNLTGTFRCIREASRYMLKKRYGRIINISSVIGIRGNAGQANYSASKAGIIGLTKSTAKEFGSRGITCNAIAPGFIETDMTKELSEKAVKIIEGIPLKRMGKPEDVAETAAFFASDAAGYITGQVICADGGMAV